MNYSPLTILFSSLFLVKASWSAAPEGQSSRNWNARASGWHFYDPHPKEEPAKKEEEKKAVTPQESAPQKNVYTARLEAWQENFKEAKAKAIFDPTPENVAQVQHMQRDLTDRSLNFGRRWMELSLQKGILNYPEANPSPQYREIAKEQEKKQRAQDMARAKDVGFGLFFLTKEGCPYCEKFAPTVKEFAKDFGLDVLEIASGTPSGFFEAVPNNGIGDELNRDGIYPMLFLVDTKRKHFHPLARGLSTPSQLLHNAQTVLTALKKEGVL